MIVTMSSWNGPILFTKYLQNAEMPKVETTEPVNQGPGGTRGLLAGQWAIEVYTTEKDKSKY